MHTSSLVSISQLIQDQGCYAKKGDVKKMPARRATRKGRKGFICHGKFYTRRRWRAKWVTHGFRRKPRKK